MHTWSTPRDALDTAPPPTTTRHCPAPGSVQAPCRWLQPMVRAAEERGGWPRARGAGFAGRGVEALVVEPTGPSTVPIEASTPRLDRVCGERESRVSTARIRMMSSPVAPGPTTVLIARADPFLFRPGIPCWTSGLYDRVVHAWNNPYPAYRLTRVVALSAPPQGGRAASPGRSPPPHLPLRTATPGPRCCCSRIGPG